MNLVYFGLPLGALLLAQDAHELGLCVLSPVAAPGRRRLRKQLGPERVIDALERQDAEAAVERALPTLRPDLLVSWFWTRKLPGHWLAAARFGGVGVHPSLLPRHRGPNPYFWAIDSGDAVTGVSVHELDEGYDTGAIIEQREVPIGERDAWQLARALDRPALEALRAVVRRFSRGERPSAVEQDESLATWAGEPEGPELRVDFRWPSERVLRRIRALAPVPGLAIELEGQPLFLTRARRALTYVHALEPGEAFADAHGVSIRTGDGAIELLQATSADAGAFPEGKLLGPSDLAAVVRAARPV